MIIEDSMVKRTAGLLGEIESYNIVNDPDKEINETKKTNHNFEFIDLGGGMGISYNHDKKNLLLINQAQKK